MADTPNYGFYRNARFSANHLAEYLCTKDAGQRDGVVRKAKFPRKPSVVAYQQVMPAFRRFMTGKGGDMSHLDNLAARLTVKATAAEEDSYVKDEAVRCAAAIEAFKKTFAKAKWGKIEFMPGPSDVVLKVASLPVNVRFDPPLIERGADEHMLAGGCVMFLAGSADARKNIEDRRKYVAAIAHWALSEAGNIETATRLCMSFDVFGEVITKAPTSFDRLRRTMESSCTEVIDRWKRIEPPAGYDGPDWH